MSEKLFEKPIYVSELVIACFVKNGTGERVHKNRRSHGFAYNLSGVMLFRFEDGQEIELKENEIVYLPQGSSYTVERNEGDCYAVNFLLLGRETGEPFKVSDKAGGLLHHFRAAEEAFRTMPDGYAERCCKELYGIISHLKQKTQGESYRSPGQRQIFEKAKAYIDRRYADEPVTLPALAEECGVSEVYLRRIFKAEAGMAPVAYLNLLRLERARALLLSGEYTVSDVCYLSGFNDISYFSKSFKEYYGVSPKNYK